MFDVEVLACDWNGTLVDDVTRTWRAACDVLERRRPSAPDLSGFLRTFRLPLSDFFAGSGVDAGDLAQAEREWNTAVGRDETVLMPGTLAMLEGLDSLGVEVGVVSAAERSLVESDIRALGLEGRFAFVVGSASPNRLTLSRIVESRKGKVAYLGDTEHDVVEARAAGALPLGFARGYRPPSALIDAGADRLILDLRDLPALLSRSSQARAGDGIGQVDGA